MTAESEAEKRTEPVLLNLNKIDKKTDIAACLMARDYKGYGNMQNGNGVIGSIYTSVTERFQRGILKGGVARCIKAETHDLGVVIMTDVKVMGQMDGMFGGQSIEKTI